MKIKRGIIAIGILGIIASAFVYSNQPVGQSLPPDGFKIDTLAENLIVPWQLTFLPDNSMLFTERAGRVRIYRNGKLVVRPVFVVSDVFADRKTGLLGLCLHPDFARNKFVYLANNYTDSNRKMRLRVVRYQFGNDTLTNPFTILENIPANQNHTGCRLVFGPDKKLYITTGDADQPMQAQDLKAYNGKILRVNDDGSIPADNPFAKNDTARKEIWTYGHRNPQGLAFQPGTNILYESEHGPTGGDEINIIEKGANYGWPVIHHQDTRQDMVSPLSEYTPSIGPSEILFYNNKAFPQLQGSLLVACLRGESILKIQLVDNKVASQEVLLKKQYGRIRSLVTGPDGYIYFSTSLNDPPEGNGREHYDMILRMRPEGSSNAPLSSTKLAASTDVANQGKKMTPALMFQQLCASCHGDKLQGTERTKGFINGFQYGADRASIIRNITNGITEKGMPAWNGAIRKADIDGIAAYIINKTQKAPVRKKRY
ncbi:hypothetical protein GCM10023149_11060 [Mucilaginibacter gynuensis]|uniref:Cytochrome c domain-containing protein n=1 Tax=Mucilaginibacter gynuensis TaxID=1302236 RepID=A0ABP8G0G4_9SPHI